MLDKSGMLDRFVDAILYGDERKKKGKGGEELEPKGMFTNNMNLLHTRQHYDINQTHLLGNHSVTGGTLGWQNIMLSTGGIDH